MMILARTRAMLNRPLAGLRRSEVGARRTTPVLAIRSTLA